jgi:hypothetical protein
MKTDAKYITFIALIILAGIGCTPEKSKISIKIPSFRQYYPVLLKEAEKWRPDAYLDEARIFLFPKFSDSSVISASFRSPSKDFESLGVYLHADETITSEIFVSAYPINHHEPITENVWKIDSQEALEYMLKTSGRRSVNPDRDACSFLMLERVLPLQDQPAVWSLTLWDCHDAVQHLYSNASSGEMLDSSEVNIKPTRLPTLTP